MSSVLLMGLHPAAPDPAAQGPQPHQPVAPARATATQARGALLQFVASGPQIGGANVADEWWAAWAWLVGNDAVLTESLKLRTAVMGRPGWIAAHAVLSAR